LFLSASGQELGTAEIGGVSAAERGGQTILLPREATPVLPAGTRSIELILTANHVTGPYIDAYADQLSLTLSKVDVDSFAVNIVPDPHDILFGTPGADNMAAGPGNDIYHVNNAGDAVVEAFNEGTDTVYASVNYTLTAGSWVELLATESIAGTQAIDLVGNNRDNNIWGNNGANTLNGGGGNDTLVGFGGNDVYVITAGNEVVVENAGQGTDIVYVNASYTLSRDASIELLTTYSIAGTQA